MKITFLGQNCFLFEYQEIHILSDPFYNIQKEKSKFDVAAQKIDYLLITHAHEDHTADVDDVIKFHPDVKVIGQPEICHRWASQDKIDINFGGSAKIKDLKISMVPALHTSSFPDGSYGGQPCGYVFRYEGKNLYLAGDTGVMMDMSLFPQLFGHITAAILPVGSHYTMCPRKASFAAGELLKTKRVIGCHFDTFPAIQIDHQKAKALFEDRGIQLDLPELGESFEI